MIDAANESILLFIYEHGHTLTEKNTVLSKHWAAAPKNGETLLQMHMRVGIGCGKVEQPGFDLICVKHFN